MKKNLFIAIEGIDGCGKSTQLKLLAENLKRTGHQVYNTFEPTDSPIGSIIKNIFNHRIEADHRTIAGLFVADRLDHLLNKTNGIIKKMDDGFTVISSRYYFSSYAYHGVHVPMKWVIEANSLATEILRPDLNIFIDVSPDESMKRLNHDRSLIELYETKENLELVRKKYMEVFDLLKSEETIFQTDGKRPPEIIAAEIWKKVSGISSNTQIA